MSNFNQPPVADQDNLENSSQILSSQILRSDTYSKSNEYISGHGHAFEQSGQDAEISSKLFIKHVFVPEDDQQNSPVVLLCESPQSKTEEKKREETVSEKFVQKFNEHIGSEENNQKALRLIAKMRGMGGLVFSRNLEKTNIPDARIGLCMLAGLNHPQYKMDALDSLIKLLEKDSLEKESSIHLVSLAIKLMRMMNRELIQSEIIDVQIKITRAYGLIAELIQRHYAKGHINAITKELKVELIQTSKALKDLNTQHDLRLHLYTHLALEGVRRIVDDRKELFDLLDRFYHIGISIMAAKMDNTSLFFEASVRAFEDLDPHLPNAWYNGVLIMKDLAKSAVDEPDQLTGIQILLREKYKEFNWKFTYAALDILCHLTIHGETPFIRKRAFGGVKALGNDFPGLATFASSTQLPKRAKLSPMAHFKKPILHDPNIDIRKECAKLLWEVTAKSPDSSIRKKAKQLLIRRLKSEKNAGVREVLEKLVPQTTEAQERWLQPEEKNNIVRIHKRRSKSPESKTWRK